MTGGRGEPEEAGRGADPSGGRGAGPTGGGTGASRGGAGPRGGEPADGPGAPQPAGAEDGGSPSTFRRTAAGVAGGGGLFLALGLYLNLATGFSPVENPGPLLMLVLVGATVGGLVAPLAGRLLDRWRAGDGGG